VGRHAKGSWERGWWCLDSDLPRVLPYYATDIARKLKLRIAGQSIGAVNEQPFK
jgi:hypothetical protein